MSPAAVRRSLLVAAAASAAFALALGGCSNSGGGGYGTGPPPPPPTGFNSGFLPSNASFVVMFPTADTVNYVCTPHESQGMTGTVRIHSAAAVDSMVVNVTSGGMFVFSPAIAEIKPGPNSYVRWRNQGAGGMHTVTQK
jgi:plastocyanin